MENCTLEQFNLETFLAGKYKGFQTRNGIIVTSVTYFPSVKKCYVLAGVIHDEDEGNEDLDSWTQNGLYSYRIKSDFDLFAWKQND